MDKMTVEIRADTSRFDAALARTQKAVLARGFDEFGTSVVSFVLAAFKSERTFERYGNIVATIEAMTRRMEYRMWRLNRYRIFRNRAITLTLFIVVVAAICR